jgi:hypothetical protein
MSPHLESSLAPGAEQGFTLMELLVSMLTGIVVLGALLAILQFSLTQEARITDQVQADRAGRTAMGKVIDELHSSCTGFGATAIQAPNVTPTSPLASTGVVDMWYLSAYGNASSEKALLTGVTEHDVHWTSTGTSNTGRTLGTLTDYQFASTGGASPNWKFPELKVANAQAKLLAKSVVPLSVSGVSTIFQYYKYGAGGQLVALSSSELPAATEKREVAKVTISFTQAPESGDTRADRTANISDSLVLRFNSSQTGAGAVNTPCA